MNVLFKKFKIIEINKRKYGEYNFSEGINIIAAENTIEKSTLIKSIMYTLGFDIIKWSKNFNKDKFIYELTIEVKEELYKIIRYKDFWIVNDKYYSSDEYKVFLKKILEINIELLLKNDTKTTIYPTDILFYFYVDQDSSYGKKLFESNHKKIQMYSRNENLKLLKYFLKLYDKKLDELKLENTKLLKKQKEYNQRKDLISKFLLEFSDTKIQRTALEVEKYKEETKKIELLINDYINKREILEKEKYAYQHKWQECDKTRIMYENIYENLQHTNKENKCLHCGSLIKKEIIDDFRIEEEKIFILNSYGKLREDMKKLGKELENINMKLFSLEKELKIKENEFYSKKKNLNFAEILKNNINYEVKKRFENEINELNIRMENLASEISKVKNLMAKKDEVIKRNLEEIKDLYIKLVNESLTYFSSRIKKDNIETLENVFLDFNVNDTGVSSNITYVILYYTYFKILSQKSSLKFPIVWDTLMKDVFDEKNIPSLTKFTHEKILKLNNQVIISNVIGEKSNDIKIEKNKEYNFILLKDKLCYSNNTELENSLLDIFIELMKKIK